MNILFLNNQEVAPFTNGIQRITDTLARGFAGRGARCYSAYFSENEVCPKTEFTGKIRLDRAQVADGLGRFVREHEIDVVICQQVEGGRDLFEQVRRACSVRQGCQVLYCLHTCPGYVFVRPNRQAEWFRVVHGIRRVFSLKKWLVGLLPVPVYNRLVAARTRREYGLYNELFDGVVLLSGHFIAEYCALSAASPEQRARVRAVPNACLLGDKYEPGPGGKEKEVLVVGRLSDRSKRISDMLRVWAGIERRADLQGWVLRVVGTGEDEAYYHALVRRLGLKRVRFEGRQDPTEYYRRASVFAMTSAYEGFGLVLVEAQRLGCVPVAFDSFGSARDVVADGITGVLVPPGDLAAYEQALAALMADDERRASLMRAGVDYVERFAVERVVDEWFGLFRALGVPS